MTAFEVDTANPHAIPEQEVRRGRITMEEHLAILPHWPEAHPPFPEGAELPVARFPKVPEFAQRPRQLPQVLHIRGKSHRFLACRPVVHRGQEVRQRRQTGIQIA